LPFAPSSQLCSGSGEVPLFQAGQIPPREPAILLNVVYVLTEQGVVS